MITRKELEEKAENEVGDILEHLNETIFDMEHDAGICLDRDCDGVVRPLESDAAQVECPTCGKASVYSITMLVTMGYLR